MKNFTKLTWIFTLLLCVSAFSFAQNTNKTTLFSTSNILSEDAETSEKLIDYYLYVAGVQVTSANAGDLSVIPGVSGTITYNHATKTLIMNTVKINGQAGIYNLGIQGLKIKLIGTNIITSNTYDCISIGSDTEINGTGSLIATTVTDDCIFMQEAGLTIKNCTVEVVGTESGISGTAAPGEDVVIDNATVKARGSDQGSIMSIASFTLIDCAITAPVGAAFDAGLEAVALNGHNVTDQVVIEPVDFYDLYIAGVQVHSANAGDLSVISGVSGTVHYDYAAKILRLNGATINVNNKECILNQGIEGLKIELIGANTLESSLKSCLFSYKNTEIKGLGSLIAMNFSNSFPAIYMYKSPLTIKDCAVEAVGTTWGIAGWNGLSGEALVIDKATVKAKGTNSGSIIDIASLTLVDCAIKTPDGAAFDAGLYAVAFNNQIVTDQVVILPSTGILDIESANISVYPNPVHEVLHIDIEDLNFKVEFYNLQGQLLWQVQNKKSISTNHLPSGVYVLKLITEKGVCSAKLVKQ